MKYLFLLFFSSSLFAAELPLGLVNFGSYSGKACEFTIEKSDIYDPHMETYEFLLTNENGESFSFLHQRYDNEPVGYQMLIVNGHIFASPQDIFTLDRLDLANIIQLQLIRRNPITNNVSSIYFDIANELLKSVSIDTGASDFTCVMKKETRVKISKNDLKDLILNIKN